MLGKTAEEAYKPFVDIQPGFIEFRDASYTTCTYKCSILDCIRGLEYAIKLKWFDFKTFNLREYEYYEKVDNGDLNWIIPGKFVAFSGPSAQQRDADGYRRFTPEDYVPIFKKLGVGLVIRLNNKQYERERFTKNGIRHLDLYFVDGSCPSDEIIETFLTACEQEKGAIAVHCKAGLGRTGSLIAAYAMKHYKFPAADFIGYIRLARPGSILGPQQQFLVDKESTFHSLSDNMPIFRSVYPLVKDFWDRRSKTGMEGDELSVYKKNQDMSPLEKKIARYGDYGQANRLLESKFKGKMAQEGDSFDIPNEDMESLVNVPVNNDNFFRGGKIADKGMSMGMRTPTKSPTTVASKVSSLGSPCGDMDD